MAIILQMLRMRLHHADAALLVLGALAAAAAIALSARVSADPGPGGQAPPNPSPAPGGASGPITRIDQISPELQAVLQQSELPTHLEPTPWGNFIINPVINGAALLNPQTAPIPAFTSPTARKFDQAGASAPARARNFSALFLDVPAPLRQGLAPVGALVAEDGPQFWSKVRYGRRTGTIDARTIELEAFTPTGPVAFEEFPDNAITNFTASNAVLGHPTLTVFPDPGTADPRMERVVAWSQGTAVYYLRTVGDYTDAQAIEIASSISAGIIGD